MLTRQLLAVKCSGRRIFVVAWYIPAMRAHPSDGIPTRAVIARSETSLPWSATFFFFSTQLENGKLN